MIICRFIKLTIAVFLITAFYPGSLFSQNTKKSIPPFEELVRLFDYDQNKPIDLPEISVKNKDGYSVHDITISSPAGGKITAFMTVPSGKGPFAGIVFLHWGQGDRSEFNDETAGLAKKGAVCVSVNAPWHSPGYEEKSADDLFKQIVIDLRRAVDLLLTRKDVDPGRIGFVGHSLGATWGGVLAGVEKRIRAFVLMGGYGIPSKYYEKSVPSPFLDGIHYICHAAPSSLFFQFAENDEYITKEAAAEFINAASEPKTVKWYKTNHAFNKKACIDRMKWLSDELNLK